MKRTSTGIAYDDMGSGEPALLCLPGWCGPRSAFDLISPLAKRRVLSVDWRGHGDSFEPDGDFGAAELCDDALSVVEASGAAQVIPVATSHGGWVAVELRRRLGEARVPKLVLLDWMVLGTPPPVVGALAAMREPATTRQAVDGLLGMWTAGVDNADLDGYLKLMADFPDEMWARGAREIATAFDRSPVPLEAIAGLDPVPPTLHLYAQPADDGFLGAQQQYADAHPWFSVQRLQAKSHFPTIEVPLEVTRAIEHFVAS